MKNIDVTDIALRLQDIRNPLEQEEIIEFVNEKINGRVIKQEDVPVEILAIVAELIGKGRAQDRQFTIDLIQTVCDEILSKG